MHCLMHDKQFASQCTRESRRPPETLSLAQGRRRPGPACQTAGRQVALRSVTSTGVGARDGQDAMTIRRSPSRSPESPGLISRSAGQGLLEFNVDDKVLRRDFREASIPGETWARDDPFPPAGIISDLDQVGRVCGKVPLPLGSVLPSADPDLAP